MTKPDMLLWIDIETTGLDPQTDRILEIAYRLTRLDGTWDGLGGHSIITPETRADLETLTMSLPVWRMHSANGLLDDITAHTGDETYSALRVAIDMADDLEDWAGDYTLHPAGTNIDFDLTHIRHQLPCTRIDQWLSHRRLDLTAYRLAQLAQGHNPYQNPAHATDHRAKNCIERDILEYRTWLTNHPAKETHK